MSGQFAHSGQTVTPPPRAKRGFSEHCPQCEVSKSNTAWKIHSKFATCVSRHSRAGVEHDGGGVDGEAALVVVACAVCGHGCDNVLWRQLEVSEADVALSVMAHDGNIRQLQPILAVCTTIRRGEIDFRERQERGHLCCIWHSSGGRDMHEACCLCNLEYSCASVRDADAPETIYCLRFTRQTWTCTHDPGSSTRSIST